MWICSHYFSSMYHINRYTPPPPPGNSTTPPGWESVDCITAVAGLMNSPTVVLLQHDPAVFISRNNGCPACSDTLMWSDRLIYLPVSLASGYPLPPPPTLVSLSLHLSRNRFQVASDFPFFFPFFSFSNLNLNSPSDSAARQNKLFKSFNKEAQSTGVQTHSGRRWLTSYRCTGRQVCVFVYILRGGRVRDRSHVEVGF